MPKARAKARATATIKKAPVMGGGGGGSNQLATNQFLAALARNAQNASPAPAPSYGVNYGSGGGGGGGGGGYAGGYTPETDPTYQAYIKGLDLTAAQQMREAQQRKQYLKADEGTLLDETAREGELSREGIAGSFEDRGLFLSGGHEQDQARQRANQLTREGRIKTDTARGVSDTDLALAQALAAINLKKQQALFGIYG